MGKMLIVGMPEPTGPLGLCASCVGEAKSALVDALKIDAAWVEQWINQTPADHLKVVAPPKGWKCPPVEQAITMTFVPMMGAVVGQCWTHATAINETEVKPVPPGFRSSSGLIPGMS